jgi:RimJ/RimL family protein N-acetyltransferase
MLPIATERLILRPFELGDLVQFVAYRRKPEVAIYQSWSDYSAADAKEFFDEQQGLAFDTNNTWYQIAMMRSEDECLVGDVAVHFFDEGRQVEIGFTVDSDHQKQGYAVEATSAVLNMLFTRLNKHRVVSVCYAKNFSAHKLLARLGFRQEATLLKNVFFKGAWGDEYTYAMLQDEWRTATDEC